MGKLYFISHIAKKCFKNVSITSSCTVSKILNEYDVDFIKLDMPHDIKDEMALWYGKILSDCIKREEWKIYIITEILNFMNGISESNLNEEENLFY